MSRGLLSAQGLQRQISFEEQRGRERLADLAESTRRSMAEQQQRLQEIAGQGLTRIQKTRDEGIEKITTVRQETVEVSPYDRGFAACPLNLQHTATNPEGAEIAKQKLSLTDDRGTHWVYCFAVGDGMAWMPVLCLSHSRGNYACILIFIMIELDGACAGSNNNSRSLARDGPAHCGGGPRGVGAPHCSVAHCPYRGRPHREPLAFGAPPECSLRAVGSTLHVAASSRHADKLPLRDLASLGGHEAGQVQCIEEVQIAATA